MRSSREVRVPAVIGLPWNVKPRVLINVLCCTYINSARLKKRKPASRLTVMYWVRITLPSMFKSMANIWVLAEAKMLPGLPGDDASTESTAPVSSLTNGVPRTGRPCGAAAQEEFSVLAPRTVAVASRPTRVEPGSHMPTTKRPPLSASNSIFCPPSRDTEPGVKGLAPLATVPLTAIGQVDGASRPTHSRYSKDVQ